MGNICHQRCFESWRKRINFKDSSLKSPMPCGPGKELMWSKTPLDLNFPPGEPNQWGCGITHFTAPVFLNSNFFWIIGLILTAIYLKIHWNISWFWVFCSCLDTSALFSTPSIFLRQISSTFRPHPTVPVTFILRHLPGHPIRIQQTLQFQRTHSAIRHLRHVGRSLLPIRRFVISILYIQQPARGTNSFPCQFIFLEIVWSKIFSLAFIPLAPIRRFPMTLHIHKPRGSFPAL